MGISLLNFHCNHLQKPTLI